MPDLDTTSSESTAPPALDGAQTMLPIESPPAAPRKPRGFAAMSPATRSAISAKGGRASQVSGKGHRFTSEEARAAGRKGGAATHVSRGRQTARPLQRPLPISG